MYIRTVQSQIEKALFKGKVVIIYGARQVGKTTLVKEILKNYPDNSKYLNCEHLQVIQNLETNNPEQLKAYLGDFKLVVFDEAQNVKNIGLTLKIIADTFPEIQIIATGSSSFDLANRLSEPLTGRARRFVMYPLSLIEIKQNSDLFKVSAKIENLLRFGSYPGVIDLPDEEAANQLEEIASNYLYKDILIFEGIKKSETILKLLQALAFQLGNEVSYHELSKMIGTSQQTVEKYIDILEKSFVVFKLRALSRNHRKELAKGIKVYFFDLGIRNALIRAFNPIKIRNDIGGLWENFCILERMKVNQANKKLVNTFFWRTYDQKELDYIEESEGKLRCFEFKWSEKKYAPPISFMESYPGSTVELVNKDNFWNFLL